MLINKNNIQPSNNKPDERSIKEIEFCASLLDRKQYVEAWILLNAQQESIPQLFNKSLCLIKIEEHALALPFLERALNLLSSQNPNQKMLETSIQNKIQNTQNETSSYTNAITFQYVEHFSEILKESVLRLIVDCHSALGNQNKVLEIGIPLKSKGYRNVIEAINKTEN